MSHPDAAAFPPGYPPAPPPLPDPRRLPPHLRPSLPVEPRDYYAFWRAPRYRWWKGLLAALLSAFLFLVISTVFQIVGWLIDRADLSVLAQGQIPPVGPGFFLANNLSLAACILIAGLVTWLCVQQRPRWLSSVEGGVRWRWLLTLTGILLPIWLVLVGGQLLLAPVEGLSIREHTWVMVVGILLTTPLQAAGEEYLVRGLFGRAVASWFPAPIVGFVASTIVTALIFMALHGAGDLWLNAFYVVFAVVGSWVTWRTGGLEAAIAIHVVNNLVAMLLLPFTDFSDMFNREAGTGDATVLLNMGVVVVAALIVEWYVRRGRLARVSAPGRAALEALAAPRPQPGPGYGPPPGAVG
ncbi:MAG: CPBP family intramembrane metalloprotease [Propionibacteriaceae bacterium]|nr:CPBP family intramembrane metalloprotease [Propionibacteriaceae bacterium]